MGESWEGSELKAKALKIWAMNPIERGLEHGVNTKRDLAKWAGVSARTIDFWLKAEAEGRFDKAIDRVKKGGRPKNFDAKVFFRRNMADVSEALLKSAIKGNTNAQKMILELLGEYVSKQEVTHKLSGDVITRLSIEAERELGQGAERAVNQGVVEMPKEPKVLPERVRLSSGQVEEGNS